MRGGDALRQEFQTWHETLLQAVRHWGHGPRGAVSEAAALDRLRNAHDTVARGIENAFEIFTAELPPQEYARAYLLLGGYRGAHRALLDHATLSADFDWAHWQENRF